jgi:hypothetical protein
MSMRRTCVIVLAVILQGCGEPWTEEAVVALVPGWTLRQFPPDERSRKEVQLTVNLTRALEEIADNAGQELRLSSCDQPATWKAWNWLGL